MSVELKDCGHVLIKQILKDRSCIPLLEKSSVTKRVTFYEGRWSFVTDEGRVEEQDQRE